MEFIALIPARYASTRFPGKPLALLGGIPVIERVCRQAQKALGSNVAVATDDLRIKDAVEAFGATAVMTSPDHRSGTDRVREAYDNLGSPADVIINIQGDEPFIDPAQIRALMGCFADSRTQIATLVRPYPRSGSFEGLQNPNSPKVVIDDDGFAMYFSRSVIPYLRGVDTTNWPQEHQYYTHIGIYAYRADALRDITRLPQSPLERAESLEQLRWLQAGYRIKTAVSDISTIGIDMPADLARAELFLANQA